MRRQSVAGKFKLAAVLPLASMVLGAVAIAGVVLQM